MTRPGARRDFLRDELRAGGRQVTEGAVTALLDAVGSDLRELELRGLASCWRTRRAGRRGGGRPLPPGPRRPHRLLGRRPGGRGRPRRGARAAALRAGDRARPGAGHQRAGERAALHRAGRVGRPRARAAGRQPAGHAAVEGREDPPAGARLASRGAARPCGRSRTRTRTSRAAADRATRSSGCWRRAARGCAATRCSGVARAAAPARALRAEPGAASGSTDATAPPAPPWGSAPSRSRSGRSGQLEGVALAQLRRRAWPSPTCGWRPGWRG